MNIIYFSHSYRDADINDYFADLMRSEDLIPSLDPPSGSVNAAKLERHLRNSDGMVVILTYREGEVPPVSHHILFEITMGLKARKPLLVFVEDTVRTRDLLPSRVLQRRFSRSDFFRQHREHRNALQILRNYLGEEPPPRYQPSTSPRLCLVVGVTKLPQQTRSELLDTISQLEFDLQSTSFEDSSLNDNINVSEVLATADLAVCLADSMEPADRYLMGAIRAAFVPSITLSINSSYNFDPIIPLEYQPRIITPQDLDGLRATIQNEIGLYEQRFVELDEQEKLKKYVRQLLEYTPPKRIDELLSKGISIGSLKLGDRYNIEGSNVGAVGPQAHAHDMNFSQVWNQFAREVDDPDKLASELKELRASLKQQAETAEQDSAVGEVAQAEVAVRNGEGPKGLEHLRRAGKWALDMANSIGATVAAAAIRAALGL